MAVVILVVGVLLVGAVAWFALRRADALLAAREPAVLFEVDEAIEFVASALPDDVSARLSYEDVEALLGWHLVHLAGRPQGVDIGGVFGGLEADGDVALRAEVVDLVGLGFLDDAHQVAGVGQVAVVQLEAGVFDVGVLVNVIDPLGVEQAGATLDAVHDVAFFEQEFGEVAAVLASDAGDEGDFGCWGCGHAVCAGARWCCRKSAYAPARPCSRGMAGRQPKALRRRLSMSLRGVPSGWVGLVSMAPL